MMSLPNHRSWVGLALLSLAAYGCGSRQHAAIVTDASRYAFHAGQFGREARIIATFTAPPETAVYILHCNGAIGWGLQRLDGDRWTDAWAAMTNGCLSPPKEVPGGTAHVETLTVVSRPDLAAPGSIREVVPPGTYRVVWYQVLTSFDPRARPFGPELPLERRVSGPVVIE